MGGQVSGDHLVGAVEAGGTKFNCAVGRADGHILAQARIRTGDPEETLDAMAAFFADAEQHHGPCDAFGIASFGPIELDREAPGWGVLGRTPKPGWSGIDMGAPLARLGKPVAIETDVAAAALGEWLWGAAKGCASSVYVTVGTGVGGGAVMAGRPLRGRGHPEMGHVRIARHDLDRDFPGVCPFHGDCVEGLISGPAIAARFGVPFASLSPDHPFREALAYYLGAFCAEIALMLASERIVIGGGVMEDRSLYPRINEALRKTLNDYVEAPLVVPPALGDRSGLLGALALAGAALDG